MHEVGIHIIGIQEGRAKDPASYMSGPWAVITSGGHGGLLGCELWVNTDIPLSQVSRTPAAGTGGPRLAMKHIT
eukprot:6109053-Alexandrium_andersonii.AAC.1